jgi:hypothetical protein
LFTVISLNSLLLSAQNEMMFSILSSQITITELTFTSTTTWTVPAGVTSVTVECIGGGGSGGGGRNVNLAGGSGGGGGQYAKSVISVTPGNTYDVVVGTGGASVSLD